MLQALHASEPRQRRRTAVRRPVAARSATPPTDLAAVTDKVRASLKGAFLASHCASLMPCVRMQCLRHRSAQQAGLPRSAVSSPHAVQVTSVVASVLGTAPPAGQPLMEAGLDSLGAVELRNALGAAFSTELGPTVTFDHPSISALAAHLATLPGLAAAAEEPEQLGEELSEAEQRPRVRQHRSRRRQPGASAVVQDSADVQVRCSLPMVMHAASYIAASTCLGAHAAAATS